MTTLRRLAKASYGGNLSAALAEATKWIRQREARVRLVEMLGGPTLTPALSQGLDAELWGGPLGTSAPKRGRRKKAA